MPNRPAKAVKLLLIEHGLVPSAFLRYRLRRDLRAWKTHHIGSVPHLLKQKIVLEHARASKARVFIETGTYYGFMLEACINHFDRLFSIEIEPHFYRRAQRIFGKYPHVEIFFGDSGDVLPQLLGALNTPCLFWLDAHHSGGLTGRAKTDTPVRRELEAILAHPLKHRILIDDANCFDGTHEYPQVSWIETAARNSGYLFAVRDNIIRLTS